MRLVRSWLGGAISAVALCAAAACARGSEDLVEEVDAGSVDAGPDATRPLPDGSPPDKPQVEDAGNDAGGCTRRLVINEVQTRGATASDEFVELYNPNSCAVSIGGFRLAYKSSGNSPASGTTLHTFTAGTSIPANGFYVVGTASFPGAKDATFNGGMADDGQLALFEDDGSLRRDSVGWGTAAGDYVEGSAAPKAPTNGSVARKSDGVDTDDNAADFSAAATPTPGAPN